MPADQARKGLSMAEPAEETTGQRRKVLDDPLAGSDSFDEEILSEIENRLENGADKTSVPEGAGDKVELDKADLPMDFGPAEEEAPAPDPEIEVDLAGEEFEDLDLDAEGEQAPGGRRKLIIMLAAAVGASAAALGLSLWMFSAPSPSKKEEPKTPPYTFSAPMPDPAASLRYNLKPFFVPLLASKKGGRVLNVTVSLETPDDESKEVLSQHDRLLRDVIFRLLRDRPADELKKARGKRLLQAQIKSELNQALKQPLVFQVLFTEFIIQG